MSPMFYLMSCFEVQIIVMDYMVRYAFFKIACCTVSFKELGL